MTAEDRDGGPVIPQFHHVRGIQADAEPILEGDHQLQVRDRVPLTEARIRAGNVEGGRQGQSLTEASLQSLDVVQISVQSITLAYSG